MRDWPPITDPELLERQALDDEAFRAFLMTFTAAVGPRRYEPAHVERALAYPWARPARSYVARDGAAQLLDDLPPAERTRTVAAFAERRHPIVAIGSNAAPDWLHAKLAHFPDPDDRTVLVLAGDLHGVDVAPAATVTAYGAMPATLVDSPGTTIRAATLWLTDAQVTQLTWSELSYRLGRLDRAEFEMDEADVEVHSLFAYINRLGAFTVDGAAPALAAIPAAGRTRRAMTQRELLDLVAPQVLSDPAATAEDLVRIAYEDLGALARRAAATIWDQGEPFDPAHWTPYPAAG